MLMLKDPVRLFVTRFARTYIVVTAICVALFTVKNKYERLGVLIMLLGVPVYYLTSN
jgi:hypothetical protein